MSSVQSRVFERDTIEPIEIPKTIMLVNNFVLRTTEFLNNMSETCETKIASVASRINQLDVMASLLEAKLGSIPESLASSSSSSPNKVAQPVADGAAAPPPPPPPVGEEGATTAGAAVTSEDVEAPAEKEEAPAEENLPGVAAIDHPDYLQFFKLQKLRVPKPVLEMKMKAAGLDPAALDDPNMRIVD